VENLGLSIKSRLTPDVACRFCIERMIEYRAPKRAAAPVNHRHHRHHRHHHQPVVAFECNRAQHSLIPVYFQVTLHIALMYFF
jgi:hypothetical protein